MKQIDNLVWTTIINKLEKMIHDQTKPEIIFRINEIYGKVNTKHDSIINSILIKMEPRREKS